MSFKIVYENNDVIIIDKPAGILVYPDKYTKSDTLTDELLKYYPQIKNVGEQHRPGIVHRLDRETSGLLVIAKNQKTCEFLILEFQKSQVQKKYYAFVFGEVKKEKGIITFDLAKKGRKEKNKALTYYRTIEYFSLKNKRTPRVAWNDALEFTLLDVEIKTGRMHQIRRHLKMLGHPIVGDKEYSFKNLKPLLPLNRQFLHAYYLKLKLPSNETKEFKIGLPKELKEYLKELKTQNSKRKIIV
jgi:23S rRNA pseudouridine1911/1915/1917 synthase